MNQSFKSLLALLCVCALLACAAGFFLAKDFTATVKFGLRACGLVAIPLIAIIAYGDFRKENLPDFLFGYGPIFERDGLCFRIDPIDNGDGFEWQISFQNRYSQHCVSQIEFRHLQRNSLIRAIDIPKISASIECPGGAFGVLNIPCVIDERAIGMTFRFEVAATTEYSAGRGQLLRFRDGIRVKATFRDWYDWSIPLIFLFLGHVHFLLPVTTFTTVIPSHRVASTTRPPRRTIIWAPGDPASPFNAD